MVSVLLLFYDWYRSVYDTNEEPRTRRRMVGDDGDVEELTEDGQFSEPQWSASGHPVLIRRLADLSVKVGVRARFLVEVSSPTPVSVRWEKNGRTIDESDRIRMVTEGNFHCLDISPVCQEDGGLWRIKVTNMIGTTMSSAQLTLLVPKAYKKPEFVEPLRAILTAQGTVSLECKVIGVPTPLLKWFKGSNEIKAGDVLALTPTASDPTSLGTYSCLAANCMGTAESTSIVHIDGAPATIQGFLPTGPKPIFVKELRNEKAKLGGSVTLQCKVSVPPWPEVVNWYGPDGEVTENSRTHLMEDGAGLYSLKIENVTAEDNGTWKCVATNKHGAKAISSSLISVNYPKNYRKPKFLESLKAVLTEEGLVSFECKVVGYPTPNLSWFKDGQELKPGDVYQLTGTNSLGSYCCIARNCMGEAQSSAELTLEDIKSQLSEEEKLQLSSEKLPPRFIMGLKSVEAKINDSLQLSVKVSVFPEPNVMWFRDDEIVEDADRYKTEKDKLGGHHINISKLEFCDQAEWKCIATNEYGQSVTSNYVKLNIPKHFKKPKFLEDLKAVMSEEGAVNLECKVIGVPQPKLKWYKDGKELKPGDIHKIISGQDGTCCLGTYTCLAQNCMGSVSSSASLLGFEEKGEKSPGPIPFDSNNTSGHMLSRDRSLSTIHEERTSQLHDTDKSTTIDDRAEEVSFSFDGKEVSVSLYETPDLTEEEALQVVEMYAEQLSEHVTEHNIVELPPMRFTKESSTSGKLLMEAVVIDVSPEYFSTGTAPREIVDDDLRTDVDMDEFSLVEELTAGNLSPDRQLTPIDNLTMDFPEKPSLPLKPSRSKNKNGDPPSSTEDVKKTDEKPPLPKKRRQKRSTDSEKEDDSLQEFEKQKNQNMQKLGSEVKKIDSELEDDSLYEFESRKTKEDGVKSVKDDEPARYSTETGLVRTPENESQYYYSPLKSPVTVASKLTEDEATFDTAEDSAFDKSEMSVLETLAHSLHEIQKNLTAVEAHVASESSTGDMQSAQGISDYLAEPLAEVQKSLEMVEAQIQDFPAGKYSSEVLETLVQPITKFKINLALLEEKSLPSILESVAGPLEELNREISFIQQATQEQIENAKTVEQVQESLTKIIEKQGSVPRDRKTLDTISSELDKLEEKANDDLEIYYDRLLSVGSELRSKANGEENREIQDILKAVGDLVKPLKRLTAVTSKCIAVIVEDNQMGNIPSKKVVESLLKPLDALDATLSLLESVSALKSHKAVRGAGIPILYKVAVPMDELETTIKLVENLSAQSAVEFLIPPLDNLTKVVRDMDVSTGGEGFLENLEDDGTPIVRNLDDSLDIMLSCIGSIHKGVAVVDSERGIPGKLPALLKPMDELQKSLKSVEKGMKKQETNYEEIYSIAQELAKPLQSIRSEFSILQHEIEADHYSTETTQPHSPLISLLEPLESAQSCISAFHETIMCKSADDPMHLRFILYALKELSEPLSTLSTNMIKSEEVLLGKGDPYQGLKAVARSVSELRESSSAMSECNAIERMPNVLSQPLFRVQNGLENILQLVDKKDKQALNIDLLKNLEKPFNELQSALLEIEGNVHENVTEGVTPELSQAVQDLQRTILIIQEQSSFEYGDEPSSIDANIETLKSLTQPLQTLRAQFAEVQRSSNRTMIKADKALTTLHDSTRRVSVAIAELKSERSESAALNILHYLGETVMEMEAAVEDAKTYLGKGHRIDETRRILANTLKVASVRLSEVVAKADDMSVSIKPTKRKSLILAQDFIHNLKVAVEQSTKIMDSDNGTAVERSKDTLKAVEQLAQAMTSFHEQLRSIEEFTLGATESRGIDVLKAHVDKLQNSLEQVLTSEILEKNDKMILETIENDLKSVQRVLDNLLSEDATDNARMRFILAKAEAIHSDLKDIIKSNEASNLRAACQAALTVIDIGEGIMNRKSPLRMEILTQVEPEQEVSVIGELLENLNELDERFNSLKREGKIKTAEKEGAEIAMELATLQALVQDIATEASGELLDKAVELCIPIKTIEVKLAQTKIVTPSDLKETAEAINDINQILNTAIRKKEAEKLIQPSTSIIGELLEVVAGLETSFDCLKRNPLPNDVLETDVNDVGREILSLQNIIDDLMSGATSELLDIAQDICVSLKSIEHSLEQNVILNKENIWNAKENLAKINQELLTAIQQHEQVKHEKEKEFEKLFSSNSLSTPVDVPIVRSIITTIEYMQAHLQSLVIPEEMIETKRFLKKFESGLIRYGECLTDPNSEVMMECLSEMESALIIADTTRVEVRKLGKAVEGLKSSGGDLSKCLPALQSVLSPLKTLHEELSRPNSPKRLKKAELKYLESFSKSSTDLELGLMKLEKASLGGTGVDVDCMAVPIQQLSSFIENISREPFVQNLGEDSSIHSLKSLAQPIEAIKTMVVRVNEAVTRNDKNKVAELLNAIAKPVRELRTNIALIQDQAMMDCSISQLDELKQAVALMTQVGTEMPALKQPLLYLQARLQELEPEAELSEVVSELSGPVGALKQAVAVLETKGENSMLLELCHQVVDIISKQDDTLSEISSVGQRSMRADVIPEIGHEKVATVCHGVVEDVSLSDLSCTGDTLTHTHAVEQLPSIHDITVITQQQAVEQAGTLKSLPLPLNKIVSSPGPHTELTKAGFETTVVLDNQTLFDIVDVHICTAGETASCLKETLLSEVKIPLEGTQSIDDSQISSKEAIEKVVCEKISIAKQEMDLLEDHSLSEISLNEGTGSIAQANEKCECLKHELAAEQKIPYEHTKELESLSSEQEVHGKVTSLSGKLNVHQIGDIVVEHQTTSELTTDNFKVVAVDSPIVVEGQGIAEKEYLQIVEEPNAMAVTSLSTAQTSCKDIPERQMANKETPEIHQAPSHLSVAQILLGKELSTLSDVTSIIGALINVPLSTKVNQTLISFNKKLQQLNPDLLLQCVYHDFQSQIDRLENEINLEKSFPDILQKFVDRLKEQEELLLNQVYAQMNEIDNLLKGDQQDIYNLKKAVALLLKIPPIKKLGNEHLNSTILALNISLDNVGPLATPAEIIQKTLIPVQQLRTSINQTIDKVDPKVSNLCRSVIKYVELSEEFLLKEVAQLLQEENTDLAKLKKCVSILSSLPKTEVSAVLHQPLAILQEALKSLGPLTKVEDLFHHVAPSISFLGESLKDVRETTPLVDACRLIVDKSRMIEKAVKDKVESDLKGELQDLSSLRKTMLAVVDILTTENIKPLELPMKNLQNALNKLGPVAESLDIFKTMRDPLNEIKETSCGISHIDQLCQSLISNYEKRKEKLLSEIPMLLLQNDSIDFQKSVSIAVEIVQDDIKLRTLYEPLAILQATLKSISKPCTTIKILKQTVINAAEISLVISNLPHDAQQSPLVAMCESIVQKIDQQKRMYLQEANDLVKGDLPSLKLGIEILIDVPKERKFDHFENSLITLLENLNQLPESPKPEDIVRSTIKPIEVLREAISNAKTSGLQNQMLNVCELVIQNIEHQKTEMLKYAKGLLESQNVISLQKAVVLLVQATGTSEELYEPLVALNAQFDRTHPATASEIVKCSHEPIIDIKRVIALEKSENTELVELCQLLIKHNEEYKKEIFTEVETMLNHEVITIENLQKAITLLLDIPKDKTQEKLNRSLTSLQLQLCNIAPEALDTIASGQPVKEFKKVISDIKKSSKTSRMVEACEMIVQKIELRRKPILSEAESILKEKFLHMANYQKAIAILINAAEESQGKVAVISEPLRALKANLEQLGIAPKAEEIARCTAQPINTLKQVLSTVQTDYSKFELLDICQLIVQQNEEWINIAFEEVETMLNEPILSVGSLQKAVALLVDIPQNESKQATIIEKPLNALQAQLQKFEPESDATVVIRDTLEPVNELKKAITSLETKDKSQLLTLCELIIEKVEAPKALLLKDAQQRLTSDLHDLTDLKKAVDILVDFPVDKDQKTINIKKPLISLQKKLSQLETSPEAQHIINCIAEPINELKHTLSNLEKSGDKSSLFEICQLVTEKKEECEKLVFNEVEILLKEPVSNDIPLRKAVALLVDISKYESHNEISIHKPLLALQAQLEAIKSKPDALEIMKGTVQPVNELKKAVLELQKSNEESRLLHICELVIRKVDISKERLLKDAEKMLKGDLQDLATLQKGISVLVEFPLDEGHKVSQVKNPLRALNAKLSQLDASPITEDIVRCIAEQSTILKQELINLHKLGEKSELLEVCQLVLEKGECVSYKLMFSEIESTLKKPTLSATSLQKAIALTLDIPKKENQTAELLVASLQIFKAQLENISLDGDLNKIVKETLESVAALKQVVSEVKKSNEKPWLVDICELVIGKVEEHKAAMLKEAENLLKTEIRDGGDFKKAVALLADFPLAKDEQIIQVKEPIAALQAHLLQLGPSPELVEILKCTSESVRSLEKIVSDVRKSEGKGQYLDACELVIVKCEECTKAVVTTVEALLKESNLKIGSLRNAVELLVDIPKEQTLKIDGPLKALQVQLDRIDVGAGPNEIVKCTAEPIKQLKGVITDLTQSGEKSQLLDLCSKIIKTTESNKMVLLEQAKQLFSEKSWDPIKLRTAIEIVLDIPKEGNLTILDTVLSDLKTKLVPLDTSAKPHEVFNCSYESILELKRVMSTLNKEAKKSGTFETCQLIHNKIGHLAEAMEDEAIEYISEQNFEIVKLKRAVAILIDVLKESGKKVGKLSSPLVALQEQCSSLTPQSKPDEVVQKSIGPILAIKTVVSQLKEIGEPSRLVKICDRLVIKFRQHKESLLRDVINTLQGPAINHTKLQDAVTVVLNISLGEEALSNILLSPLSILKTKMENLPSDTKSRSIVKHLKEPVLNLKQALVRVDSIEEQQTVKDTCQCIIKSIESCQEKEMRLDDIMELISNGITTISQFSEAIDILDHFSSDCEILRKSILDCKNKLSFLHSSYRIEDFVLDLLPSIKSLNDDAKKIGSPDEFSTTTLALIQHLEPIFLLSRSEIEKSKKKAVEERKQMEQDKKELEKQKKLEEETKKEQENKLKDEEKKLKEEQEKKLKEEQEKKIEEEQGNKIKEEQERILKMECDIKLKAEQEKKLEEQKKLKEEQEKKLKEEQEKKMKEKREKKLKEEQETKLKAEQQKKLEEQKKLKDDEEETKLKEEQEMKLKEEHEKKMKEKQEKKLKEEQETKLKAEQQKKLEEQKKLKDDEEETKLKEEQEKKMKEKREKKLKEEQETKLKAEQQKKFEKLKKLKDDEEETKLKEEQEMKLKEEQEKKMKEKQEKKLKEEQETKLKAEQQKKLEEQKKLKDDEVETKLKEEREMKLKEEQETKLKTVQENNLQEEHEKLNEEKEKKLKDEQKDKVEGEQVKNATAEQEKKLKEQKELKNGKGKKLKDEEEKKLGEEQEKKLKDEQEIKLKRGKETKLKEEQTRKLKEEKKTELKIDQEKKLKEEQKKKFKEEQENILKEEQEKTSEAGKGKKLKEEKVEMPKNEEKLKDEQLVNETKMDREELEKERIDSEMREAKIKLDLEMREEELKRKKLNEEWKFEMAQPKTERESKVETQKQICSQKNQKTLDENCVRKPKVDEKRKNSQKHNILEEAERKEKEIKDARENDRKRRDEQLSLIQQKREQYEEEERLRKELEKTGKEAKESDERQRLEKEKEEVELQERNIKVKLEQVKKERKEREIEEHNKMMRAWKEERDKRDREEAVRVEKERERAKYQREKEEELKMLRQQNIDKKEDKLEKMKSREILRVAHLDDLHKREVARGISKSLDAVYLSSKEKLNKDMLYTASVTTMNPVQDVSVHTSRGISVVELMHYSSVPMRPDRTKKSNDKEGLKRDLVFSKWDTRLRDLSPDIRQRHDLNRYTSSYNDSKEDVVMQSWDRSKEHSWKHLEYPTPEFESPAGHHRSRRSISPVGDPSYNLRYQIAPQPAPLSHRSRRSLSPLERSINQPYSGSTVSLTSLSSRKHIDELTSARLRPPTPTRTFVQTRSRSITKLDHRAFIVNGLVDKTVIHGGKIRLSCNIGGDTNPSIEWLKEGKSIAYHTESSRYKTECNYGVAYLEVDNARLSDAGQYTCVVKNIDGQAATTCTVRVALKDDDEKEVESIENELEANMPREICLSIKGAAFGMPRVTGLIADPVVPSGGTIAVHVQVAGCHRPDVTWLYGNSPLPKYSPRVHYFEDGGLFTLLLEGATPAESGVYTCRVSGRGRGAIDTTTTVQVVEKRGFEKPALFTAKPDTRMTLTSGEDMTLTCYVSGDPRPQVILMKGIKDLTTSCRTHKEVFGEYVRLTLKRVNLEDRGTYFIVAKNIYGTDRTFVTLDIRERQKSPTPPSWSERTSSLTSLYKESHHSTNTWRSTSSLHSSFTSLYE